MKKSTQVVLILIIVLLLIVMGVGGYFLVKGNNDTKKEIEALKNELTSLNNKTELANTTTNLTNGTDTQKTSSTVASFSAKDLEIDGFSLGESPKALEGSKFGEPSNTEMIVDERTDTNWIEWNYEPYGLLILYSNNDDNPDGSITKITLCAESTIQTARGIKIGDSKEKVLQSYPSNSILKNEENVGITVGYPNDDPLQKTGKGKILFYIKDNKVSDIVLAYSFAE